jgi:Bacterial toxin homologue of phage lysozyme, C-term
MLPASNTLTGFINTIVEPLTQLQQSLTSFASTWNDSEQQIQAKGTALHAGNASVPFAGRGATAFYTAMAKTQQLSLQGIQTLEKLIMSNDRCIKGLTIATDTANAAHIDQDILDQVFQTFTPQSLWGQSNQLLMLQTLSWMGETIMDDALTATGQWAINGLNSGDPTVISAIPDGASIHASIEETGQPLTGDGKQYLGNAPSVLQTWATDCTMVIQQWQSSLSQLIQEASRTDKHVKEARTQAFSRPKANIDWKFIRKKEGFKPDGKVPVPHDDNTASGVTIGYGYDIGQHNLADFNRYDIPEPYKSKLIEKFTPYFGAKQYNGKAHPNKPRNDALDALQKYGPLTITEPEAALLDQAVVKDYENRLIDNYDNNSMVFFGDLPQPAQTAIMSVFYNSEIMVSPKSPFGQAIYNQDWPTAAAFLRNDALKYDPKHGVYTRRNDEADKLQSLVTN